MGVFSSDGCNSISHFTCLHFQSVNLSIDVQFVVTPGIGEFLTSRKQQDVTIYIKS